MDDKCERPELADAVCVRRDSGGNTTAYAHAMSGACVRARTCTSIRATPTAPGGAGEGQGGTLQTTGGRGSAGTRYAEHDAAGVAARRPTMSAYSTAKPGPVSRTSRAPLAFGGHTASGRVVSGPGAQQRPGRFEDSTVAKLYKRGKVWWVDYSDYLWRRSANPRAAPTKRQLAMLANFLTYEQHLRAGIMVVSREHKKMPFERHVKDWAKSRAADKPDEGDRLYIRKAARFLNLAAQSCGWQTLGDMTKASVTRYLEERSTTPNEHGDMPASKTIANFASYLHAFGVVRRGRADGDKPMPTPGRWSKAAKFPRRALTDKELRSLLTCETIPASRRATYALLVVLGSARPPPPTSRRTW